MPVFRPAASRVRNWRRTLGASQLPARAIPTTKTTSKPRPPARKARLWARGRWRGSVACAGRFSLPQGIDDDRPHQVEAEQHADAQQNRSGHREAIARAPARRVGPAAGRWRRDRAVAARPGEGGGEAGRLQPADEEAHLRHDVALVEGETGGEDYGRHEIKQQHHAQQSARQQLGGPGARGAASRPAAAGHPASAAAG